MVATSYYRDILVGAIFAGKLLAVVAAIQLLRGIWWIFHMLVIRPPRDPLRHLPGPEGKRFENHFQDVLDPDRTPEAHEKWVRQYGKTLRFHGFGAHDYRLMSFDFRAISHFLSSPVYEKPWQTRRVLTRLLGQGVFSKEGEEHRSQRKLMAPAFAPQALKAMTPVMYLKAEELRDRWDALIATSPQYSDEEKPMDEAKIDVLHWVSRATFDVIGLAGFDYSFQALKHESEEVYLAYRTMFNVVNKGPDMKKIIEIFFPVVEKLLPDESIRETNRSLKTIRRAGEKLVANKKAAILAEIFSAKDIQSKDILSLLIKANLSEDPKQRMSDNEILDQLSTFLFAGSDTTAISIAWVLYYLALNPSIQSELRDELIAAADFSTSDVQHQDHLAQLESLPLLDAVVRETLRIAPPVHGTIRVAMQDDVVPLSESVTLRTGETVQEIEVKKGSYVHIPIEGLNHSKDIWGDDALEFKPSRWSSLPSTARHHPGLANLMTFSFGPHACIGWRFSLLEMKIFISTLLPHFIFAPVEGVNIGRYNAIVTRPYVRSRYVDGPALPLMVSHYRG